MLGKDNRTSQAVLGPWSHEVSRYRLNRPRASRDQPQSHSYPTRNSKHISPVSVQSAPCPWPRCLFAGPLVLYSREIPIWTRPYRNGRGGLVGRNMGAEGSTARLQALVDMGFSVVEARLALEATSGNVERAAELLKAHRRERERAQGGPLVARINAFLRNQQPWSEFFDKFLWPEHLHERIETNLLYYRANYAIICGAIVGISALQQPKLLALLGASIALHYGASEWDGRMPAEWNMAPLRLNQRLVIALIGSSLLVNWLDATASVMRVSVLCAGMVLGHASFRARTLNSRWAYFKSSVEKSD